MICVLERERQGRQTQGGEDHLKTGRDWNDAATSQGAPGVTGSSKRQGKIFHGSFRGRMVLPMSGFQTSHPQNCKRTGFYCFKP